AGGWHEKWGSTNGPAAAAVGFGVSDGGIRQPACHPAGPRIGGVGAVGSTTAYDTPHPDRARVRRAGEGATLAGSVVVSRPGSGPAALFLAEDAQHEPIVDPEN